MMAVVTGGASSGKSAFAERLCMSLPGPYAYVATMRHGDGETEARIARHRKMREGKGFATVELADRGAPLAGGCPPAAARCFCSKTDLPAQAADTHRASPPIQACSISSSFRTALLEDLGNLVANGIEDRLQSVLACENVVIVANEVGGDGVQYDPYTADYISKLGGLACQLAAQADAVVEVVAGIPCVVKGELPWRC